MQYLLFCICNPIDIHRFVIVPSLLCAQDFFEDTFRQKRYTTTSIVSSHVLASYSLINSVATEKLCHFKQSFGSGKCFLGSGSDPNKIPDKDPGQILT